MSEIDYENLKNLVVAGCAENIFDQNCIGYFFFKNYINYLDDDVVAYFKHKNYSNSTIFKILFAKSLNINYGNILEPNLLQKMVEVATSDNKLDVSTLMAFTCFEKIGNKLNMDLFENKFAILRYFVENQLNNDSKKINVSVPNYLLLKRYPKLFYVQNSEMFKSKEEVVSIIDEINEKIDLNTVSFDEACETYENSLVCKSYKKM